MGFLQPLALFGLVAAAIPALLHLMTRKQPPEVAFPAVRYIQETERVHSRRLKLRNLLLLVLRTLLIVAIVLAASRPVLRLGFGGSHAPTAVGLVIDNSLSSGQIVAGTRVIDMIRARAISVLDRVGADDRLWIVMSDGVPRSMGIVEARGLVDTLDVSPVRLDIGRTVRVLDAAMRDAGFTRAEVVVLSDLQSSAMSSGSPVVADIVFWEPPAPPENHGLDSVVAAERGPVADAGVTVWVGGRGSTPVAARLSLSGETVARAVVRAGEQVQLRVPDRDVSGWSIGEVELDADELRADDHAYVAIRNAPPAAVRVEDPQGPFVDQALDVLVEAGRVTQGAGVRIGDLAGEGARIVVPPADAALIGATNRSLEAAGSRLRFGDLFSGEWLAGSEIQQSAGATVRRRYAIRGDGEVLATAGGTPWIVRDGSLVLLGSRLEPDWTDLVISAGFVPFVDRLANAYASPGAWVRFAPTGGLFDVPPGVIALASGGRRITVNAASRAVAPEEPGVYFMLTEATDTVGALTVSHDSRESLLGHASPVSLRAAFGAHVVGPTSSIEDVLFGGGGRADLTTILILAAVILAMTELWVATSGGKSG